MRKLITHTNHCAHCIFLSLKNLSIIVCINEIIAIGYAEFLVIVLSPGHVTRIWAGTWKLGILLEIADFIANVSVNGRP